MQLECNNKIAAAGAGKTHGMRMRTLALLLTVVLSAQALRPSVRLQSIPNGDDGQLADSGIDYTSRGGKLVPATVTVPGGRALKDVLAPDLWEEFGLDPVTGDPVEE